MPLSGTQTSTRVTSQSSDIATGAVVDLATLLTLAGTSSDANTVASVFGRLTKIRDLLNGTLTVSESNSSSIKTDLDTLAGIVSSNKAAVKASANDIVDLGTIAGAISSSKMQSTIAAIAASLSQANQVPVSNSAPSGLLTISESSLTANSDNTVTFSATARRIRIQNESSGTIYWKPDATASTGSASLVNPGSNAVSVEWIAVQCSVLHIFVPSGGTTTLNGSGGVKVMAWA
jgi:hypothetical protein